MKIVKLTDEDRKELNNEIFLLENYFNDYYNNLIKMNGQNGYFSDIDKFLCIIDEKNIQNKKALSNNLKTPLSSNSLDKELFDFFHTFERKNNHYIQEKWLKNIITEDVKCYNYATFFEGFKKSHLT